MNKNIFVLGMLVMTLTLGFIGCDNGNNDSGDITVPTLSSQTVALYIGTADGTTAKIVFTSNEAGSYYVQVLSSVTPAPAASVLAESGLTGTVVANTGATVDITGLTKGSAYKAHVTVKDVAGNYSAVWSSDSFTPTQKQNNDNPLSGTWRMDTLPTGLPATLTEVRVICTDTAWETYISGTGPAPGNHQFNNIKNCWGTWNYSGYPAIWTVEGVNSQYTTLKVGDTGIATISEGKMHVSNFIEPYANGIYTKQP
jgi:hypothetical protein